MKHRKEKLFMKSFRKLLCLLIVFSLAMSSTIFADTYENEDITEEEAIQRVIEQTNELNSLLEQGTQSNLFRSYSTNSKSKLNKVANEMLYRPIENESFMNYKSVSNRIGPNYQRGEIGNYLVTTDGWIGDIPLPGHAGIVSSTNLCIESFKEGVGWYYNDWDTRYDKVFEYRVNYSGGQNVRAAAYAEKQVGDPYNYNFFNVWTESKFYCSQLVWRAWYENGADLDGLSNGVVAPVDLTHANNATIIYSSLWK